jgi:adenylate cyclase
VDIRGSTSFAESVPPFDVIHVLRRFYHPIERAVIDNGGHVACYTGDGLMALFGVEPSECAALDTVRAGLDMLRSVKEDVRPYVKKFFQRTFRIGVGVRFGEAIVGTVGGGLQERVTAIGDAVNIASRVERANKKARTEFLVSEAFEWGTFEVTFRESEHGSEKMLHGKILRILKKQSDGSWKFARVMALIDKPEKT